MYSIAAYFGVKQYFGESEGRIKMLMTSKNLEQYYTLKCLIGELLSNITFSQNSANALLLSRGSGERE